MTEIQWLVQLMLDHKLPGPVKEKFIARIGEVEAALSTKPRPMITQPNSPPPREFTIPKETVVSTGSDLKGPRKW